MRCAYVLQGDESVLVTVDSSVHKYSAAELETKLTSIQHSMRALTEETGFCASVELVTLGDDGQVVRGAWTPVGSSSRSYSGGGSSSQFRASASVYTPNTFASLGGGGGTTGSSTPRSAWGASAAAPPAPAAFSGQPGSVIGPAAYKVSVGVGVVGKETSNQAADVTRVLTPQSNRCRPYHCVRT
jgi:transcriptional repressor NF-X1